MPAQVADVSDARPGFGADRPVLELHGAPGVRGGDHIGLGGGSKWNLFIVLVALRVV